MSAEESNSPSAALAAAKEAKKALVIASITEQCKDSEFHGMKTIRDALSEGGELVAKVLSGGETNFSFKVFIKNDPSKALFAKLSFTYALWNPDKSVEYDLERCVSEFNLMKSFSEVTGGPGVAPVVEPYCLLDVDDGKAKLSIYEWSKADVQFSNQFTDGKVDIRVLNKLADAIATLNLQPAEESWNDACRDCFASLTPVFKQLTTQFSSLPEDQADECVKLVQELGLDYCLGIIDAMHDEYLNCREVLNHNDTKQWNILVEATNDDGSFGPEGKFALCDWEMSIKGKMGKDVGVFLAFAPASAFCHAIQGHKEEAYHLLGIVSTFWKAYVAAFKAKSSEDNKKDEEFFKSAFKGMMGGFYLYLHWAYYGFGLHADALPLEGVSEADSSKAKGAMGVVSLKAGEIAYAGKHSEASLSELEIFFEQLLRKQVDDLLGAASGVKPRRSSVMVQHSRKSANFLEAVSRRASEMSSGEGPKRASIYDVRAPLIDISYDDEEDD